MDTYHTDIRLQLLANGYAILPNRGKVPVMTGWNEPDYVAKQLTDNAKGTAAQRVARWEARFSKAVSTGVRIEDGLGVVDSDTDDESMTLSMWQILRDIAPDVHARAPLRFGGGDNKAALFVRIEGERWVRIASRRYPQGCLEIFGGAPLRSGRCSRQFGIYGPHSFNEDDTIAREYVWADEDSVALHQVAAGDLPTLTKAQAFALVAAFERLAEELGWTPEAAPVTDGAGAVYDIDENTRFDTSLGHSQIDYAELSDLQEMHTDLRCASNFMAGRDGTDRSRCWVFHSPRHDCTAVYVYGDEQTHYPVAYKPQPDKTAEALKTIMPQTRPTEPPPRPDDTASLEHKALWLLLSYGYCMLTDTIVDLYKAGDDCQVGPNAFARQYRAWREKIIGPKKGVKFAYATGYWETNAGRVDVEGVRMRPDMPFPTYTDNGRQFKNTYLRPRHEGSGDIAPWLAFMTHLLPAPIEREFFCNWLAHKYVNPGIPGVAIVMVAANSEGPVYGAGRGILRDILARLLGPRYVKPIDFDVFTGRSAQGVYTDWGAYATLVTVNESKDTPDAGRWSERRAVYERLREIVDPRAIERTFTVKGRPAFSGLSFASYLVFSNNRDALQIPDGDRRVAGLANGERMTPAMAAELTAWMANPGNIAELAHWLEHRDLAGFDVYQPPVTETKTTMQRLARTELDEAFATVRRRIGRVRLFTGELIRTAIQMETGDQTLSEGARLWVNRQIRAEAEKVGYQMPPAGGRHHIMCWRDADVAWVKDVTTAQNSVSQTAAALARAINEHDGGATIHDITPTPPKQL